MKNCFRKAGFEIETNVEEISDLEAQEDEENLFFNDDLCSTSTQGINESSISEDDCEEEQNYDNIQELCIGDKDAYKACFALQFYFMKIGDEDYAKKAENIKERVYKHISSKKLQTSIINYQNFKLFQLIFTFDIIFSL